jgi:CheY-like chemotaxis protein
MDLQMPEMNGLDAMVAIRNEFPKAKIIILTTYESDVEAAMKLGARAYLLKTRLDKDSWGPCAQSRLCESLQKRGAEAEPRPRGSGLPQPASVALPGWKEYCLTMGRTHAVTSSRWPPAPAPWVAALRSGPRCF